MDDDVKQDLKRIADSLERLVECVDVNEKHKFSRLLIGGRVNTCELQ